MNVNEVRCRSRSTKRLWLTLNSAFRSFRIELSRCSAENSDRRTPSTPMITSTCRNPPTTRQYFLSTNRKQRLISLCDSFPTAMHVSAVVEISRKLIPALQELHDAMYNKQREFEHIIKIGRTHLQVRRSG